MTVIPSADAVLSADAAGVGQWLETYFQTMNSPAPHLSEAMSYAALNGGKRVRASLVLSAARLAGDAHLAAPVAAALEMVHAYSLIHDDLPAMDDADTRRGMPATHIAFDEATAILAGDALQTEAFSVLTTKLEDLPADRTLSLIRILADASGVHGMAGGQMLDLQAEKMTPDLTSTRAMQELKTGALIRSAAVMGVIVVLGRTGVNFGAGMTGGFAYVLDIDREFVNRYNHELIDIHRITPESMEANLHHLRSLITEHVARTGSEWGQSILDDYRTFLPKFWVVKPKATELGSLIEMLRRAA